MQIEHGDISLRLPLRHPLSELIAKEEISCLECGNFVVNCSYMYYYAVLPENLDSLNVKMQVRVSHISFPSLPFLSISLCHVRS